MSEDSRGGVGRTDGGADEAPMLVLGEDRPDVEDTTAEGLARQRQELEKRRRQLEEEDRRRRREAEEEAERLRREAADKLAEERRQAEVELARRQRELDHAERQLSRTERRLRRKAKQTGGHVPSVTGTTRTTRSRSLKAGTRNSLLAAAEQRSGVAVPRMPLAITLALAASGLTVAGAVSSIDPPSSEAVDRFVTLDETRVAWLEAGTTLDGEVVRYLAGEGVTQADGALASVTQAEAVAAVTERDWYVEEFTRTLPPLLADPGSNPQRVLSAWEGSREAAGMAVPSYELRDAGEALDNDRALPTWLLLGGLVAVGGLTYSLARGRTWVGAGLAGLALVPAGMVVADQDRHLEVEPALEAHERAADSGRDVYEQVGRDLAVVHGTRALDPWEQEDYWETPGRLDPEGVDAGAMADYSAARQALSDVDIRALTTEESLPYAEALIEAGSALLGAQTAELGEARDAVVANTVSDLDVPPYVATTAAAALLPLAALVPAALRRREVDR